MNTTTLNADDPTALGSGRYRRLAAISLLALSLTACDTMDMDAFSGVMRGMGGGMGGLGGGGLGGLGGGADGSPAGMLSSIISTSASIAATAQAQEQAAAQQAAQRQAAAKPAQQAAPQQAAPQQVATRGGSCLQVSGRFATPGGETLFTLNPNGYGTVSNESSSEVFEANFRWASTASRLVIDYEGDALYRDRNTQKVLRQTKITGGAVDCSYDGRNLVIDNVTYTQT